jgi:hypothetical protein
MIKFKLFTCREDELDGEVNNWLGTLRKNFSIISTNLFMLRRESGGLGGAAGGGGGGTYVSYTVMYFERNGS